MRLNPLACSSVGRIAPSIIWILLPDSGGEILPVGAVGTPTFSPPCGARSHGEGLSTDVAASYNWRVEPLISGSLALIASYLLGSVSFAILVSASQGVDIRSEGSGNPGTSNVLRVMGRRSAVLVLAGDGIKGAAAAWLGSVAVGPEFGFVTLLVAVVGHTFPIWHGFRGGKSVATAIGGFLFLAPGVGALLTVVWIVMVAVWKTASIASIATMALAVPAMWLAGRSTSELAWTGVVAIFVLVRHSSNIKRLIGSSEEKVSG